MRLSAGGSRHARRDAPRLPAQARTSRTAAPVSHRMVWFNPSAPTKTPIYRREDLQAGLELHGPVIVDQMDTTTLVFPNDKLRVDDYLNLLLEIAR